MSTPKNYLTLITIVSAIITWFGTWVGYYFFIHGPDYNRFHGTSETLFQSLAKTWVEDGITA